MKNIKFLFIGILFGIILSKAEVISWYRIYEMFKFQSFHMFGIIGSAVVLGIILFLFFNKQVSRNSTKGCCTGTHQTPNSNIPQLSEPC